MACALVFTHKLSALKGRNRQAQGNALGCEWKQNSQSPNGAAQRAARLCRPVGACGRFAGTDTQGVALG